MKNSAPESLRLNKKPSLMRYVLMRLLVIERQYHAKINKSSLLRVIANQQLFSFRAQPLARGLAIGMFWMAMPMPFQMLPATFSCMLGFANLPIALLAVWISNPLTYLPIFYLEYQIGIALFHVGEQQQLSFEYFSAHYDELVAEIYFIVLEGALVFGLVMAVAGYLVAFPLSRYLLRAVSQRLQRRR